MHPRIYRIRGAAVLILGCGLLIGSSIAYGAPQAGQECRTTATGNWNEPATWENCGGGIPGAADAVFIQAGHTVTLTQNQAVGDLHISTGTTNAITGGDGKVVLGEYVLELNGRLRAYFAPLGDTPGTSSDSPPAQALTMTPASASRVRVVGSSRTLTTLGEWSASATPNASTFHLEIAADVDATVVLGAAIKAGDWTLVSGILDAGTTRISADRGANGTGNVVIGPNATLISSATGTGGAAVISRTASGSAGTLTVDGRLVLKGGAPTIGVTTVALNGVVEFAGGAQTLLRPTAGGVTPAVYNTLVLTNTGAKTLSNDATVNTRLVRGGESTLALGGYTLTYGAGAALEYAGSAAQTTGLELPTTLASLVIANAAGVTLAASTTVDTLLDLTGGDLTTGANMLDLGAGATCSGSGDVVGSVRRSVAAGEVACFGHPDVRAGIHAGSTPPTSLTVTLVKGSAPFTGAVTRQYTVAAPGFAGSASLRLRYRADELNGNNAAALQLWRYEGALWLLQTASAHGDGYVEKNDVTAFSDWALDEDEGSTAVDLAWFGVLPGADHVLLTWSTGSEATLAGFHLHRAASLTGAKQRITATPIPAQFTGQVAGAAYTWLDPSAALDGRANYYWLEMIGLQEASSWYGPVEIAVRRVYAPVVAAGE